MNDEKLTNYLSGNATDKEIREVEEWLKADPGNSEYLKQFERVWDQLDVLEDYNSIDSDADWNIVRSRIGFDEKKGKVVNLFRSGNFPLIRVAAIIVVIFTIAGLAELQFNFISIGGTEMIAISTIDETEEITLHDGTKVFLNEHSEISYPERFKKKREINLKGEAYFEVVPDSKKPFLVYPGNDLAVEVVGTSFNIVAKGEQNAVIVQVVSGEVSFYSLEDPENEIILAQNDEGIFTGSEIKKSINNDLNFLSWKTRILTFRNTPLDEVFRTLSHHYNKVIEVEISGMDAMTLTSTFENESLMDILDEMALHHEIGYRVQNDTIIIIELKD